MPSPPQRGLPARIYVPILVVFAGAFVIAVTLLLRQAFSTGSSVFGSGTGASAAAGAPQSAPPPVVNVQGGGPPAAVRVQLQELRRRIASNPKDDVALTQLGDMYLSAGMAANAIPYYRRALRANPSNVAAQQGLQQAQSEGTPQ